MTAYWVYMLKVSVCLIVFYSFYMLALKNCTFFFLNRLYLLLGLLLSFTIPILRFSIFEGQSNAVLSTIINTSLIESDYDFFHPNNFSDGITSINFAMILSVIYFIGISILFFKLLFSIIRTLRVKNSSETYQIGKMKVIKMDSKVPFSFFNLIFLPKDESSQLIISHEMAHIEQFHWFDLILIEIASVLLWFNPFVALYKSSLKLQHEYLADSSVVKDHEQIENYLGCMLTRIQIVSSSGLVSHFYCKTIKKRIVMITRNKTSVKYLGVYLLVLPLVCLLLMSFTNSNVKASLNSVTGTFIDSADEYQPSIYPLDITRVKKIADYGLRINPISKKEDFHAGIDFAIPEGEKIVSTAKGIVVETSFDPEKGNFVTINHNEIFLTFYSHLKSVSVKVGDKLDKGQVIGCSGNTGSSTTGSHLHYEVHKNGGAVNPKDYLPK